MTTPHRPQTAPPDAEAAEARYRLDSAAELYAQIEALADARDDLRSTYAALREVFRRTVNQALAGSRIHFAGMFAKLDFILKEHSAPDHIARLVHDTREALDASAAMPPAALAGRLPHDIRGAALLVDCVCPDGGEVPVSLRARFPVSGAPRRTWGGFDLHCLRCIVERWDDQYIYVTPQHGDARLKVCYGSRNTYLTREGRGDWSYLRALLRPGTQLNLVRLRFDGAVCLPELIIYEPDILVNVSTIASCFETYAESPLVAALGRLRPQPNTVPIHLGNLSGMLLDNTVHGRTELSFSDVMQEFFRQNAIPLVACSELRDKAAAAAFYEEARRQKAHIERLVGEDLPHDVADYDAHKVVLEPTFFCETLGLQGRFDFLFRSGDAAIIIEQKSGKGAYEPYTRTPDVPRPQEKHLVQLILYRALFTYGFGRNAAALGHVMLLYSKYARGLVSVGQMPELMLRALRMRNLLAAQEMRLAEEGFGMLENLTPEALNAKQLHGRLWDAYVRPQLDALLAPIRAASSLERAYYFRFLHFLEKEHLLARIGTNEKDDSGFATLWHDSPDDKRAAGNIYDGLSVESFGCAGGGVERVRLRFPATQEADTSNFRRGDIVLLYRYVAPAPPDACAGMVVRATIAAIDAEGVELVLRNRQTDPQVFRTEEGTLWAVEHDMLESSAASQYAALHAFLSAPQQRRDLVLGRRAPQVDASLALRGSYGAFDELVRRARQARELFLVIGPPGTGKTSFGLLNVLREELLDPAACVLLLSYTNRAVDEICSKLVEHGIDFVRIGSELSCEPAYHAHLLANRLAPCRTVRQAAELIDRARVVCGTTSALNARSELFSVKRFGLAIVDEASQILEPQLVGLLAAMQNGEPAIGRFVLIGDHKQLPAVVRQGAADSRVGEPELRAIGLTDCRRSFFERMLSRFRTSAGYDPRHVYMLTRQGRMHRDIAEFPNLQFYGGRLDVVPLPHQLAACPALVPPAGGVAAKPDLDALVEARRVVFAVCPKPAQSVSPKANPAEAELIARVVAGIYRRAPEDFSAVQTVGVIVPYRNQIATIRTALARHAIPALRDITIDTVERFQGSQRDYIIYGFTVQFPYQLNFLTNNVFFENGTAIDRKLNVAMTRARRHLLLVGNPDILRLNPLFRSIMAWVRDGEAAGTCAWWQAE